MLQSSGEDPKALLRGVARLVLLRARRGGSWPGKLGAACQLADGAEVPRAAGMSVVLPGRGYWSAGSYDALFRSDSTSAAT